MTKQQVRERLLRKLHQQPEKERLTKSLKIAHALHRLPLYRKARLMLCYAAIDGEVETGPILAQALADGKRVAVPVALRRGSRLVPAEIRDARRDLSSHGLFGVPQPTRMTGRRVRPEKLELILVPGVAFDRRGRRLGRGKGYFDRFLSQVPASVPRIGLAFGFQVVRAIPFEPHDQPVRTVITDKEVIRCENSRSR